MIETTDCFGRQIRLTDERLAQILDRSEMQNHSHAASPAGVRVSRSELSVRLFYESYARTRVGDKWLCVVVKYLEDDAFVITAYLTDKLKAGEISWPTK